jgi:hypothetical protein
MNTNFYATKDRPRGVKAGRRHMGGEQYRQEMRAALHDLQQRLGQCHNSSSSVRVVGTAGPVPSTECRIRRKLFQKLQSFTPFLLSARYFEYGQVEKDIW